MRCKTTEKQEAGSGPAVLRWQCLSNIITAGTLQFPIIHTRQSGTPLGPRRDSPVLKEKSDDPSLSPRARIPFTVETASCPPKPPSSRSPRRRSPWETDGDPRDTAEFEYVYAQPFITDRTTAHGAAL